jgi:hypothetical protein
LTFLTCLPADRRIFSKADFITSKIVIFYEKRGNPFGRERIFL